MDVAGSAADVASDLGCSAELKHIHEKEGYVDALLFASLRVVRKGLPVEVQRHGVRMLQHLLEFRKEELSISELADLRKTLGGSLDDFGLKGATNALDNPVDSTANSKENDKHMRSLIVLAANNSSTSLSAMETSTVFGKTTAGGGRNVSPESGISSNSVSNSDGRSGISNDIYCRTLSEDYDYLRSMNNRDNFGDMASTINACKGFVEFADSGTLVMGETMSSHQGKGYLLLVEHNIICQAFLIVKLYSWIQQYEEIFPCLLSLLNKIWTLPEWRSKYLHDGSGLTSLFSDNLFLKMVYYLVKFCEEDFKRSRTGCCEHLVTLVQLILPLYLELLQCIHGLWYPTITCNLSEEIQRAKYPDPFFPFECTARSVCIKDEEICQEKETRELLEEILESGYYLIGLCTYINGAFSSLLNGLSVSVALSKYLGSLEFRHLKKLIKFTVIPLVKNCPYKYWKEWVDNLLQPLLRHCEKILHYAWFRLLHHGRAGVPYYFGKLSGSDEKINSLENHVLVEFTREVSGLLEILALTEQNRLLSQDTDSMPSTSLFRYLVTNDCFGKLRMSLFGYFVDDTATAKAIPFCRALVCFAVASNDAKLRIFILDNLLPCLIQCLDNQLPCAIQSLKYKLNSGVSDNAGRDLVVLAQQLYGYMLNSGYVQTQAVAGEDKDGGNAECSFKVWLERQKDIFRVKAYSAAAKEFPNGYRWNWEFEDECQRYLSVYIDMLQEVDAVDDFAEHICLEKESLFQKLSLEFRSKYAISSCVHPFMETISSIQKRKFYSMAAVVRNRKMCKLVRKLITLKPYIKGSDCSCEVVYRLKRTNEVPPELSKSVAPSVELLLHSILFFWEPRFHPMIREAHMDKLLGVVDGLTESECKPVAPIISDLPLHLQPYAQALVETKLKESKYYIAKEQICLHEEFDKYLASGELDAYMDRFMSSKDYVVEELIANRLLPSQFWLLDRFLTKLSFERRAQIVHLQTEICTYTECLRVLFENEQLKFHVQSLIAELEAEGFFDVNSDRVNWGKIYFAELIDKFSSEVFAGNSLPKHYAIRGLIDCRTILVQKDVNWQEAFEKVVVDACNDFIGYLPKFWKDTRYYEHQYYALVRDPLKQVLFLAPYTN